MADGYNVILAADDATRRDLFMAAAQRLGTSGQNIEKDFWVCWTLDLLFNHLPPGPRLLFKGGTSLSKGFALIDRFSEDIDVTVFRQDIGEPAEVAELEALSGKKRAARLDAIRAACQDYINNDLQPALAALVSKKLAAAGLAPDKARVEPDPEDPDRQTLLLWYPKTIEATPYIRSAVKIESGAKSALDPHQTLSHEPYVAPDVPDLDLEVPDVTIVDPTRTFWDKVVILHGTRRWFDHRGELRGAGQRVSRHYYDLYRLLNSATGQKAAEDIAIAADCIAHAQMFFYRKDFDLAHAKPGSFTLVPSEAMLPPLRADYRAMSGMLFGEAPDLNAIIEAIRRFEAALNES
jgi:hypothetical protein